MTILLVCETDCQQLADDYFTSEINHCDAVGDYVIVAVASDNLENDYHIMTDNSSSDELMDNTHTDIQVEMNFKNCPQEGVTISEYATSSSFDYNLPTGEQHQQLDDTTYDSLNTDFKYAHIIIPIGVNVQTDTSDISIIPNPNPNAESSSDATESGGRDEKTYNNVYNEPSNSEYDRFEVEQ